jgi:hypothetical protein
MPVRPPNFRLIALIAGGTFNLLGALWIFADARARRARKPLFAALAMILLGPLWLAFYMTDRPLRAQERRSGGFGFTWTRHFTTAWTASLVPWLAAYVFLLRADLPISSTPLLAAWLVPVVAATVIGYSIRRADAVEASGPAPAAARVPLAVVCVLAAILTFLLLTVAKKLV